MMVSLKTLLEKLGRDATAGDYVKDFRKSDAPQFKGKSDKKKQKMAIAAYLDAKDSEKNERISTVDVDQKKRDLKVARIDKKIRDLKSEGSGKPESWEAGYKRRVVKTTKPEHKEKGMNWRIKGKDRPEISIRLYKEKPSQAEFNKQMRRVAGHEFGG